MSLLSIANRISLNGRLIGGFGLLMVLSAGTSIFYNARIRDVRDNVTHIARASLATDTVGNFSRHLLLLRRISVDYFRSGSATDRKKTLAAFEPLDKSIDAVREAVGPRGDVLRSGLSEYHTAFSKLDDEIKKRQAALQAMNASSIRLTNTLTTVTLELGTAREAALPAAQRLEQAVEALRAVAYRYAGAPSAGDLDIVTAERERVGRELALVKTLPPADPALAKIIAAMPPQVEKMLASSDQLVGSAASTEQVHAAQVKTGIKLGEDAEVLRSEYQARRSEAVSTAARIAEEASTAGSIAAVTVGVLAVILTVLITISISTLIKRMTRTMSQLADGDLRVEIEGAERADQIGNMARAVSIFKDNAIRMAEVESEKNRLAAQTEQDRKAGLRELASRLEHAVKDIADAVKQSAQRMHNGAATMSGAADRTKSQSGAVASASGQASANVQTVASAAEELSASIREIGQQAQNSANVARRAAEQASRTTATMEGLSQAADRIGEVINLINSIAAQTNLLALNATIEAARAGDAGRGFAVVASEVKNLAAQTARATEDIAAQISSIQGETKEAATAIKGIESVIMEINQIATTTASAVEEQGAATAEIARNVQQAAAGTDEVSSNIAGVLEAAAETDQHARIALENSNELTGQADRLWQAVIGFVEDVKAA
ncbi:methyl-accepting chemotaxis protein [Bradyrhizobium sp.]|uniref:methyl-accepting chemotaxis protein n=1 Tax=Bradyrhizobium sp. TaxID=376 RepID=UPI00262812C1|nr:methyl-accepting chemotaxis protein [Bradyrhizobium sp.]